MRYVTMTLTPFLASAKAVFLPNPWLLLSKRFLLCLLPLPHSFITFLVCVYRRTEKSGSKYTNLAYYCLILSGKMLARKNILYNERMRTVKSARKSAW